MKPRYISLSALFGAPVRFVVPLFQRPYVWDRKDQWEPLWEDVFTVAGRVLNHVPHASVRGHFLGSVVLEQESTGTGSIERRAVIDGQQRLTILQILLKAGTDAFREVSIIGAPSDRDALSRAANQLASLTSNPSYAEGEEVYKVWPTNQDRLAFRSVMDANSPKAFQRPSLMSGAYAYFRAQITNWLQHHEADSRRSSALADALMKHLNVIVLDLEASDEPQAIFETLNTGGAPLLTVDLVKNWLLWEAVRSGLGESDCADLHEKYWLPFDADGDYWRQKVGAGHASRPRVDTFLVNWLTEQTCALVTVTHVYEAFVDYVAAPARNSGGGTANVATLMHNIHEAAGIYRKLDTPGPETDRFTTFLHRLKLIPLATLHPLLMHLLSRRGSNRLDLDACAIILESFLIRRLVCNLLTRGISMLAIELLNALIKAGPDCPAAPVVQHVLENGRGTNFIWPDDAAFSRAWLTRNFYELRGTRPLMILRALEEQEWHCDRMAMPVAAFDWSKVQVEHIMPQSWKDHWKLPGGGDTFARDTALHQIGNLTLVSGPLNASISNGDWQIKREALGNHVHMRLTAKLAKVENWNEAAIADRSAALFELARVIWPGPHARSNGV